MKKSIRKPTKKQAVDSIERLLKRLETRFSHSDAQIEKLAQLVADGFADIDERFDHVDERFEHVDEYFLKLQTEVHNGFEVSERHMDRIETRIATLEFAVFGVDSVKGKHTSTTWFDRIEELEKAVFKKTKTI